MLMNWILLLNDLQLLLLAMNPNQSIQIQFQMRLFKFMTGLL